MTDEADKDAADDVSERLTSAIEALATGIGTINERLTHAAHTMLPLHPGDFPGALQHEFAEIMDALSAKEDQGQGGLLATLSQMSPDAAHHLAMSIWSLFRDVEEIRQE